MKSMTGFGEAHSRSQFAELDVKIKSVNGRFLDVRFHVPREYFALEMTMKNLLKEQVQRGTVDISVTRSPGPAAMASTIRVEPHLAKKWLQSYRQLGRVLGLPVTPKLSELLQYPEIVKVEERIQVSTEEKKQICQTFAKALTQLQRERAREGEALKRDLLAHITHLRRVVEQMKKLKSEANLQLQRKTELKMQKLIPGSVGADPRIAQEVAILLERSDVSEELARLEEHVRVCAKLFNNGQSVGKKLDFYTQELLREVNTIGSKSQLASLTHLVVESKSTIERIREQVQNIE